jgi:hypothetical protein
MDYTPRWQRNLPAKRKYRLTFNEGDLEICNLLSPTRAPWGYQYLPSGYFPALLNRREGMKDRLGPLSRPPNTYLKIPEQPHNNYRDLIYSLDSKGADELREAGHTVPRLHLRKLPHELMACCIGASFEIGATKHELPITIHTVSNDFYPDWPVFSLAGSPPIYIEADLATETLDTRKADATSIAGKFVEYIKLLEKEDIIVLFITTRDTRRDSMAGLLGSTLKPHQREMARHFGFMSIQYDRFVNTIPKLSDWAVSSRYHRAIFPHLNLLERRL